MADVLTPAVETTKKDGGFLSFATSFAPSLLTSAVDIGIALWQAKKQEELAERQILEDRRIEALNLKMRGEDISREEKWKTKEMVTQKEQFGETMAQRNKEFSLNRADAKDVEKWNRFQSVMGTMFSLANNAKTSTAMQAAWAARR